MDALGAVQGGRLITVLGGVARPLQTASELAVCFAPGPIVVGPTVPHLFAAGRSARAAMSGLVAARGWPEAPRPVLADDLLPERVLTGDPGQIDNPYVDSQSNGLAVAADRFRGQKIAAHIVMTRGERSELAEIAVEPAAVRIGTPALLTK